MVKRQRIVNLYTFFNKLHWHVEILLKNQQVNFALEVALILKKIKLTKIVVLG